MKKKTGFTLAETLITLGVIGVIAAILIPLIGKSRPDERKIMYLKAYDSLTEIVKFLANNSAYYPVTMEFDSGGNRYSADVSNFPLYNINSTLESQHQGITGESKLCKLIAEAMNGQNQRCDDTISTASDGSLDWTIPSFTTSNGMTWIIGPGQDTGFPPSLSGGVWRGDFCNNVYLKLKPEDNEFFKFSITGDGKVHIQDDVGAGYVNSRHIFHRTSVKEQNNGEQDNPDANFNLTNVTAFCGQNEYWNANTNSCTAKQGNNNNQQADEESSGGSSGDDNSSGGSGGDDNSSGGNSNNNSNYNNNNNNNNNNYQNNTSDGSSDGSSDGDNNTGGGKKPGNNGGGSEGQSEEDIISCGGGGHIDWYGIH